MVSHVTDLVGVAKLAGGESSKRMQLIPVCVFSVVLVVLAAVVIQQVLELRERREYSDLR